MVGEAERLDDAGLTGQAFALALAAWESAKSSCDAQGRAVCCRILSEMYRKSGQSIRAEQHFQLALQSELDSDGNPEEIFSPEILILAAHRAVASGEADAAVSLLHAASWPSMGLRALVTSQDSEFHTWRPREN